MQDSKTTESNRQRHTHQALLAFLDELERELLAEARGPLHGRIQPIQRPYSDALDAVHAEREAA